jgi:hypothetical protein
VLFTFLTCPPNFLWQEYLEETFPGKQIEPDGTTSLHRTNTAKKFLLDQTIGTLVNTAIFIGTFAAFKGKDGPSIRREVRRVCFCRKLFAVRCINEHLGDLPADEKRMEVVASRLDPELYRGTGPSPHSRWLDSRTLLGHLPEHACSGLMSVPAMILFPIHLPNIRLYYYDDRTQQTGLLALNLDLTSEPEPCIVWDAVQGNGVRTLVSTWEPPLVETA